MSKSYPKYYLGGETCTLQISVPPSQALLILIQDVQLSGLTDEGDCSNGLVLDYQAVLCGELQSPLPYLSRTGRAALRITSSYGSDSFSRQVLPLRGWLIEIIPTGCTPPIPAPYSKAYLAEYNSTHATYHCLSQFVFSASNSSSVTLYCIGQNYHSTLSPCVPMRTSNLTQESLQSWKKSFRRSFSPSLLREFLLPIMLSLTTFILSVGGLIIILLMKMRIQQQPVAQPRVCSYKYCETLHI